jgi:hypothetical protein
MPRKKLNRGRRSGQAGKAHFVREEIKRKWPQGQRHFEQSGISLETLESWKHAELATHGNFLAHVQDAAFLLGRLANEYKRLLAAERVNLEGNRRGVTIPLPFLPAEEKFSQLV